MHAWVTLFTGAMKEFTCFDELGNHNLYLLDTKPLGDQISNRRIHAQHLQTSIHVHLLAVLINSTTVWRILFLRLGIRQHSSDFNTWIHRFCFEQRRDTQQLFFLSRWITPIWLQLDKNTTVHHLGLDVYESRGLEITHQIGECRKLTAAAAQWREIKP